MVAINDITDEINRLMVRAFPAAQAHINLCPVKFSRPAYLIQCPKVSRADVNRYTVSVTAYYIITFFTEVNDYALSDTAALTAVQEQILNLFGAGYISVADRKLKLKASTGGLNFDEVYIDLQLEYYDDRPEKAQNEPPLMAEVALSLTAQLPRKE
jgi:hypothetical protein